MISMAFTEEDMKHIMEIRPGGANSKDIYAWEYSRSGHYSVKSGYWVLSEIINKSKSLQEVLQPSLSPIFQQVWKAEVPPKIQHFMWKCLTNCLPVAGNLTYRHLAKDSSCPRCPGNPETVNHLLFKCSFARLVWAASPYPAPPGGEWSNSVYQNLYQVLTNQGIHPPNEAAGKLAPWLLWRLWKIEICSVFREENLRLR